MKDKFIELTLGSYIISHGYNAKNKEMMEPIPSENFVKKLVPISRIKSVSEKYILTDYVDGRWIYWEYEEDYNELKKILVSQEC
ncbi:hypothetical protein CJ739_2135 [Mariniflexile rhizosphaerae]|uniref:hypothetical protein n=1 Tax=unclassified Mariniflexile TaxID=2643887 RepID=UPI000CC23C8F|nr:hypothetical protein [Mariniflexile sp. TRM1-10]AXP81216.1 hypothetical protein CJ739_2135 [Mariniflexile sp. TRM1-10]PLB18831.1 MAG: hypothetical protein TRG1_2345 [Flavobacteriaceae bacterium FS1-H7996/R]